MRQIGEEIRSVEGSMKPDLPGGKFANPLFQSLAENLSEGVILVSRGGRIDFSNPIADQLCGSANRLAGKYLSECFTDESVAAFLLQVGRTAPGDRTICELESRTRHGKSNRLTLAGIRWKDPTSTREWFVGTVAALPTLLVNQTLAADRTVIEDQTALVFRFLPSGSITYVNEAYCRYWGKNREELVGSSLMAIIPKEDRPRIRAQFISLSPACPAVTYDVRIILPPGPVRWQQRTDRAVFNQNGQAVEYISVGQDITERKLAEATLKHQLAMEEIVMTISTRFINVSAVEIDREIQRALRQLGEFLEIDRCYIQLLQADRRTIQKTYAWTSPGSSQEFREAIPDGPNRFDWAMAKLLRREPVQVNRLVDLPEAAFYEKATWLRLGIRAILVLPLTQGNQLTGFFGFDSARRDMAWSEDEIRLLKVIGEIFVSVWIQKQSNQALQETQSLLKERMQELENRTREINLLTEMSNMLQIASQFDETYLIVADYATKLFPGIGGSLWMIDLTTGALSLKRQWGRESNSAAKLSVDDCWALRRGRVYRTSAAEPGLFCRHIGQPLPSSSICIPILMQGKTVGLLHLETAANERELNGAVQQLSMVTAEQVGLALFNLQLRQDLRDQAIRDALTGLYNRYYMEISLERELNRAARSLSPVSLMILDIDHFRDINDRFSHAGGDRLLSELGKILRSSVRAEDIACRYGGEEFILILPDTPIHIAEQRAEQLRREVKELAIWHEGQQLAAITLSIGLSCWPHYARTVYDLIHSAESALERAKLEGRDRVLLAG